VLKIPLSTAELIKGNILSKNDETEMGKIYNLTLVLKDYSDIRTRLLIFPNKNVAEESVKKQYYKIKDLKTIGLRLRLLIMMLDKLKNIKDYTFYFKYPRLSYSILMFMITFTYFFNIEFVASYALLGVISLFVLTSRYYQENVHPYVSSILLSRMHPLFEKQKLQDEEILRNLKNEMKFQENSKVLKKMNKLEQKPESQQFEILTRSMLQEKKNLEELEREELNYKDDIDEGDDEEEKDENLKDKLSNYFTAKSNKSGIAKAMEAVSNLCFMIDTACTVYEKVKNLLLWKSRSGTMLVFVML